MIFVECNADEALVRHLTRLPRKEIAHELKGKYEVCKRVASEAGSTAMVDEDPGSNQPPVLALGNLVEDFPGEGLKLYRVPASANRIVVICPRLEDWVVEAAKHDALAMDKYGLPNDAGALRKALKAHNRPTDQRFERLMADLQTGGSPRLVTLRRLLTGRK